MIIKQELRKFLIEMERSTSIGETRKKKISKINEERVEGKNFFFFFLNDFQHGPDVTMMWL